MEQELGGIGLQHLTGACDTDGEVDGLGGFDFDRLVPCVRACLGRLRPLASLRSPIHEHQEVVRLVGEFVRSPGIDFLMIRREGDDDLLGPDLVLHQILLGSDLRLLVRLSGREQVGRFVRENGVDDGPWAWSTCCEHG